MSTKTTTNRKARSPATKRETRRNESRSKKMTVELTEQFRDLRMPMFREHFAPLAEKAAQESRSHLAYLAELTDLECQARWESRIARLMQQSRLPTSKTWNNFDWTRLPLAVARQMESLRDGSFLDRRENLLLFGKPGSGKSHCLSALGEQLVHRGRSVLFTTCSLLVQQLLIAKRDLRLAKVINRLSKFDALKDVAQRMAFAVQNPFAATLAIQSPSKVFEQYGIYTVQGYVRGVTANDTAVKGASASMAGEALTGMNLVIGEAEMAGSSSSGSSGPPTVYVDVDMSGATFSGGATEEVADRFKQMLSTHLESALINVLDGTYG